MIKATVEGTTVIVKLEDRVVKLDTKRPMVVAAVISQLLENNHKKWRDGRQSAFADVIALLVGYAHDVDAVRSLMLKDAADAVIGSSSCEASSSEPARPTPAPASAPPA